MRAAINSDKGDKGPLSHTRGVPVNYRLLETVTKEEFLEFSAKMSVHNERRWKATQAERRENKKYAEEKGYGKSKKTDRPGWVGGSVSWTGCDTKRVSTQTEKRKSSQGGENT